MPRSFSIDDEQFERAVSELEDPILNQVAARPLSSVELAAQYPKKAFRKGWQFEGVIGGKKTTLNLLLPFDFPYVPPSFGLVPPPTILTYPHVEEDGMLCLLFDGALVDPAQPVEIVKQLLSDAVGLLEKSYAGENHEDFRDEFLSYWGRVDTPSAKHFRSLLDPIGPSRIIRVWHGANSCIFAEDEKGLIEWLGNLGGKKQFTTYPAGVIWLKLPMLTDQYPKSNTGVLATVRALGDENALRVLRSLAVAAGDGFDLLIGARASTGVCFAGVSINKPTGSSSPYSKQGSPLTKGFRPAHVPKDILATRYLNSAAPVTRHEVDRADHAWIHGRDVDAGLSSLASKRVVIIGCGSIGSLVAKTLATAGVGTTTFIDPQKLGWPNIGRHFLGAKYVDIEKAKGMEDELQVNFPHLRFHHRIGSWEAVADSDPDILDDSDLIVSAVGHWSSEGLLNKWQRQGERPPLVYGWTEEFASAGHAVAIFTSGACFRCQLTEHGDTKLRVTRWPGSTLRQEPACGIMFQPYGPVELNNSANLVAELAIDVLLGSITSPTEKVWASRESIVASNGGSWSEEWLELTGGNTRGAFTVERVWEENSECPICGTERATC